jgi:hypothetical protein
MLISILIVFGTTTHIGIANALKEGSVVLQLFRSENKAISYAFLSNSISMVLPVNTSSLM